MASLVELAQQHGDDPGFYAAYSQANNTSVDDWAKALGVSSSVINKYMGEAGFSIQDGRIFNPVTPQAKQAMAANTSSMGLQQTATTGSSASATQQAAAAAQQQQQQQ